MHLIEPGFAALDEQGAEFASLGEARAAALVGIRDILAADLRTGNPLRLDRRIDIKDAAGTLLASVRFSEAIVVEGDTVH